MAKLSDLKTLLAGVPRAKRAVTADNAGPASATIDSAVGTAKTAAADLDRAHAALVLFLAEARSHGWRCVRVIHGKGLSSPNREPVLKGKVRRWLAHRNEVLAYCEATRHGGGSGAVMVLLMAPSPSA